MSLDGLDRMNNAGSGRPQISVITRTMGEPLFLSRVFGSLCAAAPQDTQWIVVDDSGNADPIIGGIMDKASQTPNLRPLLVRSAQRHRAKAMNAGLAAATGGYIHILDDDDTIDAEFYTAAAAALEDQPRAAAAAVRAQMVEETIDRHKTALTERRRTAHFPEIQAIAISTMLVQQVTPPCSILFRSKEMHDTGLFSEEFEVCEDYEFLLRFLLRNDIILVDRVLCAFHTRPGLTSGAHANSESSWNHAEADAKFRNALLRRSLSDPSDRLGHMMLMGDLARGAAKIDRATLLLRRSRLWRSLYRLFRSR